MAHKINGALNVVGQILNLKPEVLSADPQIGDLGSAPRIWVNGTEGILKFFNGTAVQALGDTDGITEGELTTALTPYAKTADVTSAIGTAVAGLASDQDVTDAVANLVSQTAMTNAIENALAGLDFQSDVVGLESDFVATSGRYIYVDGSTFATGVAAAAGDIVVVDASGVITANAYDVSAMGAGALVWNTAAVAWLRWNGSNWAEFGGLTGVSAGNGITKTGDEISIKLDGNTLTVGPNGLKVGDLSATYATLTALTNAINTAVADLQTAAQVTAAIESAVADFQTEAEVNSAVVAALTSYAKSADVTTQISTAVTGLASSQSVTNAIENALAGLDFQADILGMENQFAGVPGRYIIIDGAQGLHATNSNTMDIIEVDAGGNETKLAYDVSARGPGALVWNRASSMFMRWDGATWSQFGGISGVTAGNGIEKSGDTVSVKAANNSIVVAAGGISVGDLSATYVTPAALTTATADFQTETEVQALLDTATADFLKEADIAPIVTVVNAVQLAVSASFFAYDSGATVALTHTVTHNLNYQWPNVTVIDRATNKLISVDDVDFTDANTLTITLGEAAAIRVAVAGRYTPE